MIRHIVFFSVSDPQHYDAVYDGLNLLTQIGDEHLGIRLEVGKNERSDGLSNDIDFVVYGEFADQQALDFYRQHALYAKSVAQVRPLREIRHVVDYTVSKPQESKCC